MRELVRPRAITPDDYATHEVVFAFWVVVPDGQDDGRVLQLLWSDVKADGFVENRVDGVLLEGRLLGLDGLLEVDQRDFYVRICKKQQTQDVRKDI